MSNRYVDVTITRQTKAVSEKGFGTPLVLATSKNLPYKVYTDIEQVTADFATTTEEYKLLSRMFGQNPRPAEIAVFGVQYNGTNGNPAVLVDAFEHANSNTQRLFTTLYLSNRVMTKSLNLQNGQAHKRKFTPLLHRAKRYTPC